MSDPKFQAGQQVEAYYNSSVGYVPGVVQTVETKHTYHVRVTHPVVTIYAVFEDEIREPKPTPEQAWEKVGLLIGHRAYSKSEVAYWEEDKHDRETRHQCYQILGAAQVKITDEVKDKVRRLIELADNM